MAIEKKLICFARLEEFERQLAAGNIKDYSIVLIQDAKKIYNRGTYYDCSGITQEEANNKYVKKTIAGELAIVNGFYPDKVTLHYALPGCEDGNEDDVILSKQTVKTINGKSIYGNGDIEINADNVYITDFTVNDLQSIAGRDQESIQSQTSLLYEAVVAHKIILVPYDTDEGFQGYGVAVGYYEDMIYLTVLLGGEFIDLELAIDNDEINGGQVALRSWYDKQDKLVSGTNIKTINGTSLLGSGNIEIESGGEANVQSDWLETNSVSDSYVKNRTHYVEGTKISTSGNYSIGLNTPIYYREKVYNLEVGVRTQIDTTAAGVYVTLNGGGILNVESFDNYLETFPIIAVSKIVPLDDMFIPETIARTSELKTINGESIVGSGDLTIESGAKIYELNLTDRGNFEGYITEEEWNIIKDSDRIKIITNTFSTEIVQMYSPLINSIGDVAFFGSVTSIQGGVTTNYVFGGANATGFSPYSYLISEVFIPTKTSQLENDSNFVTSDGLKTINGESIVGSGNIEISGGGGSGTITEVKANGTSIATSGVANIPAASTSAYGVTKLSSATNSTSTTLAATASAVKAAYDLASGKASMSDVNTAIANAITTTLNTAV